MAQGTMQSGVASPSLFSTSIPESALHGIGQQLVAAWNAHDVLSFAALFDEDAALVAMDGHIWRTRGQIESELEAKHRGSFRVSRMSVLDEQVSLLSPTVALMQIRWELVRLIAANGSSLPHLTGTLLLVLTCESGSWKIVRGQNTGSSGSAG